MTNDDADRLMGIAISGLDRKEFRQAALHLENVAANCSHLGRKALATFNLGALYWSEIGDGETARKHFIAVAEMARTALPGAERNEMQRWRANACENLMLLSLSFDEYEQWAAELETVEPTNDILRGQRPRIRNYRDEGKPWSAMLFLIAQTYYNRGDPSKDRGRYACALATFRLMLGHRKTLRLNRDDWGVVTYEVGALAMRTVSDCVFALEKRGQPFDHTEFNFIAKDTLPLVEEYMAANPADQNNSGLLNNLRGFLQAEEQDNDQIQTRLRTRMQQHSSRPAPRSGMMFSPRPDSGEPMTQPPVLPAYIGCVIILAGLGAGIGALVDWTAGTDSGKIWGTCVGAGFGVMIVVTAWMTQKMARNLHCSSCHRAFQVEPPNPFAPPGTVVIATAAMQMGAEGVGRRCRSCGRIVCTFCDPTQPCACGAGRYEQVHLHYTRS